MGKNLRNSLDLSRRNKEEIGIRVEKLEDVGISINQMIVAIILIVIGFTTYYLVPYSVAKMQVTLLFMLMNMILVLVILGLTFICMLVFEYIERFLLWLSIKTCCRKDKRLHHVISKNMIAHRPRNSKTSIMFTLAISYLIFSASSFLLLSSLIIKQTESLIGADIRVNNPKGYLNEIPIAEFLDNQMDPANGATVVDYAFVTQDLRNFQKSIFNRPDTDVNLHHNKLRDLSDYHSTEFKIFGVPQNFMQVINEEFYIPTDMQTVGNVPNLSDGKVDAVGLLYSDEDFEQYPCYDTDNQDCFGVAVQSDLEAY